MRSTTRSIIYFSFLFRWVNQGTISNCQSFCRHRHHINFGGGTFLIQLNFISVFKESDIDDFISFCCCCRRRLEMHPVFHVCIVKKIHIHTHTHATLFNRHIKIKNSKFRNHFAVGNFQFAVGVILLFFFLSFRLNRAFKLYLLRWIQIEKSNNNCQNCRFQE